MANDIQHCAIRPSFSILGKNTTRALSNYILVNTLEIFMCSSGVKKGTVNSICIGFWSTQKKTKSKKKKTMVVSNLKLLLVGPHCSSKYLIQKAMQVWIDMGQINDERNLILG